MIGMRDLNDEDIPRIKTDVIIEVVERKKLSFTGMTKLEIERYIHNTFPECLNDDNSEYINQSLCYEILEINERVY